MKQLFEHVSAANGQMLSLPMDERAAENQNIRTDFSTWMLSPFRLSASQLLDSTRAGVGYSVYI